MSSKDETRRLLEELLTQLHAKQEATSQKVGEAYLQAKDGQFLGTISSNKHDKESLLNKYGPYGSRYSQTSIFNEYSKYGSRYGIYSINNPQTVTPPEIIVNGRVVARVTANPRVQNGIDPDSFLATLRSNPELLLEGQTTVSTEQQRQQTYSAYIEAEDGTFLGKLNPNEFDSDSIFNEFGSYGSEFSPTSIFNDFSTYGGEYASQSPFNEYTSTPPKVFLNGNFAGYLTVNQFLSPRIDPNELKKWARSNLSPYG